jgi:hypothetical protein
MVPSSVGDLETATRIGNIRTMVDAHLLARYQLEEAGADPSRAAGVLRRAHRRACADLGALLGQSPKAVESAAPGSGTARIGNMHPRS